MLSAHVMRMGHRICMAMTCRSRGPMHGARHDENCRATQHRDPGCEKHDAQIDGEEAAHHGVNLQRWTQGEMPVRNPVTRTIRNPKPSSSIAVRLRRAAPASWTSCGCTRRKLYAPITSVIATKASFRSKTSP